MNEDKLNRLVDETAELMRLFQNQCLTLSKQTDEKISRHMQEIRDEAVRAVLEDIRYGLGETVSKYESNLQESRSSLAGHTKEFNHFMAAATDKGRQILKFGWIALAVSFGLLLLSGVALTFYYKYIIQDLKPEAEMVQLINESDIVRCGDRLCVKTEKNKQGNYSVVKKRS